MNPANNKQTERLIDFATLSAWLVVSISMAFITYTQFGQDFRGYFAAAKVLLDGGNPYDYHQVAPVLREVTGFIGNNPFYYPLWFGWLVSPLALMPYQIARAAWMVINVVVWVIGLRRLQTLLDWPRKGWRTWSMNLLATFIFAWMTWKFEQTGIILFAVTVEALMAYRNKQWTRMGIFLAAALLKPNIMLIPIAVLSLWLVRNKRYRPVFVMATLLISLVVLTTILTPDWYQPLLQPNFGQGLTEVLDGPNKTTGVRLNTTMMDWLKMLQAPDGARTIIYAAGIFTCLLIAASYIWRSKSLLEITTMALLINFVITPYALQYDFAPLTIVLFWTTALAAQTGSLKVPVFLIAFIASVLVWERPISDGYWIIVGLCLLSYWSIKLTKKSEVPESLF